MSVPLNCFTRVTFNLVVNSAPHKHRIYCEATGMPGDPTGQGLVARPGYSDVGFSVAADRYWALIGGMYKSGTTTFGSAILEAYSSGAWIPFATWSTAITAGSGTTNKVGTVTIATFRDEDYNKVKQYLCEPIFDPPSKATAPSSFGGTFQNYIEGFYLLPPNDVTDPVVWARGRSDKFIKSFTSATVDTDDKFRRMRGLA